MRLPGFGGVKFNINVEVIEDRRGGEYTWFTKAGEVFTKPSNTLEYQIRGFKNKLRAPPYRHLSRTKRGDFMRIYVPAEGDAYIMEVKKKTVEMIETTTEIVDGQEVEKNTVIEAELRPVYREGDKEWQDFQMKKSHEDWTKKSFADKWLVFIMVIVVATIFIIGTYLNTQGQQAIASSAAGVAAANTETAKAIAKTDERWGLLIERIDRLLLKYGITAESLNLTLINNTFAPPG